MNKRLYIIFFLIFAVVANVKASTGNYSRILNTEIEYWEVSDKNLVTMDLDSTILRDDTLCVENLSDGLELEFDVLANDNIRSDAINVTLRIESIWSQTKNTDPHASLNSNGDFLIFKDRDWDVVGSSGIAEEGTIVEAEYYLEYAPSHIQEEDTARVFLVYSNDCQNFTGIVSDPVVDSGFLHDDTLCVDDDNVFIGEESILKNDSVSDDFTLTLDETTVPHFGIATLSRYEESELEIINVNQIVFGIHININESIFDTLNVKYSYFGGASNKVDSVRYIVNDRTLGQVDSAWVYFDIGCNSMAEIQQVRCDFDSILKVDDNTCTVKYKGLDPKLVSNPLFSENYGALPGKDSLLTIGEYNRYSYFAGAWSISPISFDVCETFLIVEDVTSPAISSCPSDIESSSSFVEWDEPMALDNCSIMSFERTDTNTALISGSDFPCGITKIEYTAIDSSGNIQTCAFDIEVDFNLNADWILDKTICTLSENIDLNSLTEMDSTGQNLSEGEYLWYLDGKTFDGILKINSIQLGEYELTHILNVNGCSDTIVKTFNIIDSEQIRWKGSANNRKYCKAEQPVYLFDQITDDVVTGLWLIDSVIITGDSLRASDLAVGSHDIEFIADNEFCRDPFRDVIRIFDVTANWEYDTAICLSEETINFNLYTDIDINELDSEESNWYLDGVLFNGVIEVASLGVGEYEVSHIVNFGGCNDTVIKPFTISTLPSSVWDTNGLDSEYCQSGEDIDLTKLEFVSGGKWYLNDTLLSSGMVILKDRREGTDTVEYKVDQSACRDSLSSSFMVWDSVDVSWSGLETSYCKSVLEVDLIDLSTVLGGMWSLNDTVLLNGKINLDSLIDGETYVVKYERVNELCVNSLLDSFTVWDTVDPSWDTLEVSYCKSDEPISLTTLAAMPGGSWFIGDSLVEESIDLGNLKGDVDHVVKYEIINGSCSDSLLHDFLLWDTVDVSWSGLKEAYCMSDETLDLKELATVSGGFWYLNNESLTDGEIGLDSLIENEKYIVKHEVINGDCIDSSFNSFEVSNMVDATWEGLDNNYCKSDENLILDSLVLFAGGEWYLNDTTLLTSRIIDLDSLEAGTNLVEYKLVNNACRDSLIDIIDVFDEVDARWDTSKLADAYCESGDTINLIDWEENAGGKWYLLGNTDSLLEDKLFVPSDLPLRQPLYLEYRLTNVACLDSFQDEFFVNTEMELSLVEFTGEICSYVGNVNLDSLFEVNLNGDFWTIEIDDSSRIMSDANLEVSDLSGVYNLTYTLKDGGCVLDTLITITVDSGTVKEVDYEVCNDTLKIVSENTISGLWLNKVPDDLEVALVEDSILFSNINYGNSTVTFVELEGVRCNDVINYKVNFVEQIEPIDLGEDIHLDHDERTFSILGGQVPLGYEGEWFYDQSAIEIDGESSGNISGIIFVADTFELVWSVMSEVCLSVSDTVLLSKKSLQISGGFSPNDDGINDSFEIIGGPSGRVALTVINRWGQIVYQSDDYNNDWHGTINGNSLITDTYYYTIQFENGETTKGVVVIKE